MAQKVVFVILGGFSIVIAIRAFTKTGLGWWRHGEMLFDTEEGNDVWALL